MSGPVFDRFPGGNTMKWMILVMFVAFFAGCKAVPSTLTVSAHASQGDLIALDVTVDVKR